MDPARWWRDGARHLHFSSGLVNRFRIGDGSLQKSWTVSDHNGSSPQWPQWHNLCDWQGTDPSPLQVAMDDLLCCQYRGKDQSDLQLYGLRQRRPGSLSRCQACVTWVQVTRDFASILRHDGRCFPAPPVLQSQLALRTEPAGGSTLS